MKSRLSFKEYQNMTEAQLLNETKLFGVKNIKELVSINNNLAKEIMHRNLTSIIFKSPLSKNESYNLLSEAELLNYSLKICNDKNINGLNEIRKYDEVLYEVLRSRQLTKMLADQAQFKSKGRDTKVKENKLKIVSRKDRYKK